MRTIDADLQTQLESPNRSELTLVFLTILRSDTGDVIRLVCEENGNVSHNAGKPINYWLNSQLHAALPFRIPPLSDDDRAARASIVVPAFNRQVVQWFRELTAPPRVTLDLYGASAWGSSVDGDNARSPSTTPNRLYLAELMWVRNVTISKSEVVCELGGYDFSQEPLGFRATQEYCPDLFR